jgi:phosphohistidine phosphatase
MKTLLILRHGKAERDAPGGDKDRALAERGRRDAATMGRKIASLVQHLDSIVTSDARRAHQTASIAASSAGYSGEIVLETDIYGADTDDLLTIVRALPDSAATVLLVGHNPTFEELTNLLSIDGSPPADLPTCGLAHLEFDTKRWRNVAPGSGHLHAIYTPKAL